MQARNVSPPRALHCDFPLGRPLGRPLDPAFQRGVLLRAFELLGRTQGPVLESYPESIRDEPDVPATCPLPPRSDEGGSPAVAEARALVEPWRRFRHAHAVSNVGRVLDPDDVADDVPDAVARLVAMAKGSWWDEAGFASEEELYFTVADVRAFYEEAALGLLDEVPAARQVEAWFFQQTETGKVLIEVAAMVRANAARLDWHLPSGYIVPLSQVEGAAAGVSVRQPPPGVQVDATAGDG
jgi:hypothetical protein